MMFIKDAMEVKCENIVQCYESQAPESKNELRSTFSLFSELKVILLQSLIGRVLGERTS